METRTIISIDAPGHGLYRATETDVEDVIDRYSGKHSLFQGRRGMLHDANEIGSPVDFSDLSTPALAIVLASFTPGSSAL